MNKEQLTKLEQIKTTLSNEKQIYERKWKELAPYLSISFSNWDNSSPDAEKLLDTKPIYDTTVDEASDLMANGIQGYACGASNPWFELAFEDEKYSKMSKLGGALKKAEERMYKVFAKSAFYDSTLAATQSVVNLATAILWMEEDAKRAQPCFKLLHPRDCYIAENKSGEVDVLFREFWLTKDEAVEAFGNECPENIKNCNDSMQKFKFTNYVGPRSKFGMEKAVKGTSDFISVYWESGKTERSIKEEEYTKKPFAVWRYAKPMFGGAWGVDSPGMKQLSNIKQVNSMCADRADVSKLTAHPYGKKTVGLKVNVTPNGFTELGPGQDFAIMQPGSNLAWTSEIIKDLQQKIKTAYYSDYFLILSATIEQRKTATEANGLQEEKSVIMSSFFSRMGSEFLEPIIEWTFANEAIHGRLPEMAEAIQEITPEETEGEEGKTMDIMDISVDFISQLAKTQERASKHQPNIAYVNQVIQLMQIYPEARFKLDIYKFLDEVANSYGTNRDIVVSNATAKKEYQTLIQAQMQQAQQQQSMEKAERGAAVLKDLGVNIGNAQ